VSGTTIAEVVEAMVKTLEKVGQPARATLLLGLWLQLFVRPAEPGAADNPAPAVFCRLFDLWLQHFGASGGVAWTVCRQLLPRLRRTLADTAVTLEDRTRFIAATADLRRGVVEAGLAHAAVEPDAAAAALLHREVLLWDLELGQRILLERFLAGPLPEDDARATGGITLGWSLGAGSTPAPDSAHPDPAAAQAPRAAVPGPASTGAGPSPGPSREGWLEEARRLVRRGISAADLRELLRAATILVRALFLADGRLTWAALGRSDNGEPVILAQGHGQPQDRLRLRWANAFHDLRLALAWSQLTPFAGKRAATLLPLLRSLRQAVQSGSEPRLATAHLAELDRQARDLRLAEELRASLAVVARLALQPQDTSAATAAFLVSVCRDRGALDQARYASSAGVIAKGLTTRRPSRS
jgi:hypothetical protein